MAQETKEKGFRDYEDTAEHVRDNYKMARIGQTHQFAKGMHEWYRTREKIPMPIWDAIEKLNEFVDLSDPDMTIPNMYHLLQTAEAIRNDGLPDWFQLIGLIHDLGKIMYIWGTDETGTTMGKQWAVVGDTFITGCKIPDSVVYPEFNQLNPDMADPIYQTENGVYEPGCGLDQCICSWGHDEYLYQVIRDNIETGQCVIMNKAGDLIRARLPEEAMYMIRYHSLYPWHKEGEYKHLMNEQDHQMLPYVQQFNKYDLYSKMDIDPSEFPEYIRQLRPYYEGLIEKYLGTTMYF